MRDKRTPNWAAFKRVVREAGLVVAADASLGFKTYSVLHALRPQKTERLVYNFRRENNNQYILYRDEERVLK